MPSGPLLKLGPRRTRVRMGIPSGHPFWPPLPGLSAIGDNMLTYLPVLSGWRCGNLAETLTTPLCLGDCTDTELPTIARGSST